MRTRYSAIVVAFYATFLLFFAGGRFNSGDAFYQLQAATLLVTTGHLGTRVAPAPVLWFRNKQGIYYEYHDLGQVLFFAPAAWLGTHLEPASQETLVASPPRISRFLISLAYPLLAACGCWYLWRLYTLFYTLRTAFILSFVFAVGTIFFPYSKSAWDVTAGCVGVCATLFYSARLLRTAFENHYKGDAFALGLSVAIACLFRVSLTPFLWIGVAGTVLCAGLLRSRKGISRIALLVLPIVTGLAMSMAYNALRTGSPFRTGATGPYSFQHTLRNPLTEGLYGLFISPNRGLFVFAPVFLLLLAVPFLWKRFPQIVRPLIMAYGLGAMGYILLIARLSFWGSFGWGPRYLMPVLPILFLPVGFCLAETVKNRVLRFPVIALVSLSVVLAVAPVLTNWHLASTQYPGASDPYAKRPYQLIAVGNGLRLAAEGKSLPAPAEVSSDPIRNGARRFPDLWTVRLMERGGIVQLAGITLFIGLLGIWSYTLRWLFVRRDVISATI